MKSRITAIIFLSVLALLMTTGSAMAKPKSVTKTVTTTTTTHSNGRVVEKTTVVKHVEKKRNKRVHQRHKRSHRERVHQRHRKAPQREVVVVRRPVQKRVFSVNLPL